MTEVSRRAFLGRAGLAAGGVAVGGASLGVLAACTDSDSTQNGSPPGSTRTRTALAEAVSFHQALGRERITKRTRVQAASVTPYSLPHLRLGPSIVTSPDDVEAAIHAIDLER